MNFKYKDFSCEYELYHIKWNGINFDKEKLIKFIKRIKLLNFLSYFSKSKKEELDILNEIYSSYDEKILIGLLNNDPIISRNALIEKWARIASIDLLLTNVFSRPTYTTISNFPIKDFQLVMKRIEELVKIGKEITYQSEIITDKLPINE